MTFRTTYPSRSPDFTPPPFLVGIALLTHEVLLSILSTIHCLFVRFPFPLYCLSFFELRLLNIHAFSQKALIDSKLIIVMSDESDFQPTVCVPIETICNPLLADMCFVFLWGRVDQRYLNELRNYKLPHGTFLTKSYISS